MRVDRKLKRHQHKKRQELQIWKLQRPIFTTGDYGRILIYRRNKHDMCEIPMTKDLKDFFGEDFKVYVEGRLEGGQLHIERKVPDPGW